MVVAGWAHGAYADYTIYITRSDDWAHSFRQLDASTDPATVLSLTGRTWAFEVATTAGVAQATGTVTEDPTGTLLLELTAAQTTAMTDGVYKYSLVETYATRTTTLLGGSVWVLDHPTP